MCNRLLLFPVYISYFRVKLTRLINRPVVQVLLVVLVDQDAALPRLLFLGNSGIRGNVEKELKMKSESYIIHL